MNCSCYSLHPGFPSACVRDWRRGRGAPRRRAQPGRERRPGRAGAGKDARRLGRRQVHPRHRTHPRVPGEDKNESTSMQARYVILFQVQQSYTKHLCRRRRGSAWRRSARRGTSPLSSPRGTTELPNVLICRLLEGDKMNSIARFVNCCFRAPLVL